MYPNKGLDHVIVGVGKFENYRIGKQAGNSWEEAGAAVMKLNVIFLRETSSLLLRPLLSLVRLTHITETFT